jgi:outer membrane protein OmpA-like peptidoglycan-associated protein
MLECPTPSARRFPRKFLDQTSATAFVGKEARHEVTLSPLCVAIAPIALVLSTGCSHAAPAPRLASDVAAPIVASAPLPEPAPTARATMVNVSRDSLVACNINDLASDSGGKPLFAFDSSARSLRDQHLLTEVAQCLTSGPLTARSLALVGRADPRGTERYNMQLGDRRAESVERYLEQQGMVTGHLSETSRGALDATGHDVQGWKLDRRVDVNLAI